MTIYGDGGSLEGYCDRQLMDVLALSQLMLAMTWGDALERPTCELVCFTADEPDAPKVRWSARLAVPVERVEVTVRIE